MSRGSTIRETTKDIARPGNGDKRLGFSKQQLHHSYSQRREQLRFSMIQYWHNMSQLDSIAQTTTPCIWKEGGLLTTNLTTSLV